MDDCCETQQLKRLSNNQKAFLLHYARLGTITHAAKEAGVDRCQHTRWLEDPDYVAAYEMAHAEACDVLRREARERATTGWDEPVFHNGEQCGVKRRFSDALLIFLMKGAMPDEFRDNVKMEHAGAVGGHVTVRVIEDKDWYRNDAHERDAARIADAGAAESPTQNPGK